jgi:hypothetical protein
MSNDKFHGDINGSSLINKKKNSFANSFITPNKS